MSRTLGVDVDCNPTVLGFEYLPWLHFLKDTIMLDNDEYVSLLKNYICEVTFTKRDGSERVMICTLKDDLLPYVSSTGMTNNKVINDYIPVFDLEENGWRAFKPSKVIHFKFSKE